MPCKVSMITTDTGHTIYVCALELRKLWTFHLNETDVCTNASVVEMDKNWVVKSFNNFSKIRWSSPEALSLVEGITLTDDDAIDLGDISENTKTVLLLLLFKLCIQTY